MIRLRTARKLAVLAELRDLGLSRRECADLCGIGYPRCVQLFLMIDRQNEIDLRAKGRSEEMARLYVAGLTMQQIATKFGISRQRIQQLLSKHHSLTYLDGGQRRKVETTRRESEAKRDRDYLMKWGCTFAQWQHLRDVGQEMLSAGRGLYQTPLRAYQSHRNNAKNRAIEWQLTLWQWWTIWQESGHWGDRGRGVGYVMCRYGDMGPYSPENVFVASAAQNSSDGQRRRRKDPSLPIGVRRTDSGKFEAHRSIGGQHRYLGLFLTPGAAHAAYLRAHELAEDAA